MKNRIEIIRRSRIPRITQEQLGEAMGTTKQTVSRLASGVMPLTYEWMQRISDVLGCQPYEIIADKNEIIGKEAAYLSKHSGLIEAYQALSEDRKQKVNDLLFEKRKEAGGAQALKKRGSSQKSA